MDDYRLAYLGKDNLASEDTRSDGVATAWALGAIAQFSRWPKYELWILAHAGAQAIMTYASKVNIAQLCWYMLQLYLHLAEMPFVFISFSVQGRL